MPGLIRRKQLAKQTRLTQRPGSVRISGVNHDRATLYGKTYHVVYMANAEEAKEAGYTALARDIRRSHARARMLLSLRDAKHMSGGFYYSDHSEEPSKPGRGPWAHPVRYDIGDKKGWWPTNW